MLSRLNNRHLRLKLCRIEIVAPPHDLVVDKFENAHDRHLDPFTSHAKTIEPFGHHDSVRRLSRVQHNPVDRIAATDKAFQAFAYGRMTGQRFPRYVVVETLGSIAARMRSRSRDAHESMNASTSSRFDRIGVLPGDDTGEPAPRVVSARS